MKYDPDEMFKNINGELDESLRSQQRKDAGLEAQAVKAILAHAKVPWSAAKIASSSKQLYGTTEVSFRWMAEKFPRFPIRLLAAKIPWMQNTTMSDLFGQPFMRTKFMVHYAKQLAAHGLSPEDSVVGLVFNCPRAVGATLMVVHNRSVDVLADLPSGATRIVHVQGKPRRTYVVEGIKDFVAGLGAEWTSDAG